MILTTVNKLSDDAIRAIDKLCREDNIGWLTLEEYEGKIGIYDDGGVHLTLKDGLEHIILYLDDEIDEHETLSKAEIIAFKNLCELLHVDYEVFY